MPETFLTCPHCKHAVPLTEALSTQLRAQLERTIHAEYEMRLNAAREEAEGQTRMEYELLKNQLAEQKHKLDVAHKAELELREKAQVLEARGRELDLEVARRLDEKKNEWEAQWRLYVGQEQDLKLKEKEKQIDDLRRVIDELKRKSEQGSQELQGEVLELDVQSVLESRFPHDLIRPVPKGTAGGDLIQEVRDASLNACGSIVWEVKNTKHFSPAWLEKLKFDQRNAGASVAVLISVALPEHLPEFGLIDGVWVASRRVWPALAVALREQIVQIAYARNASQGKGEKMECLYQYLAGDEFRHRVESIVDAFTALQEQLNKERRLMEKQWAEREKQIQRVMVGTVGMYGALQGIIGTAMPGIPALDFEEQKLLMDGEA